MLTLILSIYVLLMAVIPCCAFDKCTADQEMGAGGHKEPQGSCSPFYSCHSCSVPVILEKPLQMAAVESTNEPHYAAYQPATLQSFSFSCWNPPRA
ncbi:hypothetical protein GO495_07285 [Chitinophaga oryziterrae]|uniref:Secreted protein n=1 Tax=Chitinophaga oryziterrae TaxID=1031224 RepID=A0A6N8J5B0_9BACT|nr:hypothetical protein [Chitinophaga oryziterrae]MVT40380.1 hypothetical protein [Chitinophaga oryziterrae]